MIRRFPESSDVGPLSQSLLGAFGRTDLYVAPNAANASDDNPGSIAEPLATLNEALRRVNTIAYIEAGAIVVVHLASGVHDWSRLIAPKVLRSQLVIIGDGAGQPGDDGFTELLGSTTAGAGTDQSGVNTVGLTPDAFQGKTLEILSGGVVGKRSTITTNTATRITSAASLALGPTAPASGDTFRVVESAVEIRLKSATGVEIVDFDNFTGAYGCGNPGRFSGKWTGFQWVWGARSYVALVNMRIIGASGGQASFTVAGSRVVLHGVEIDTGGGGFVNLFGVDGIVWAGGDQFSTFLRSNLPKDLGLPQTDLRLWGGWGAVMAGSPLVLGGTFLGTWGFANRVTFQTSRFGFIGGFAQEGIAALQGCDGSINGGRLNVSDLDYKISADEATAFFTSNGSFNLTGVSFDVSGAGGVGIAATGDDSGQGASPSFVSLKSVAFTGDGVATRAVQVSGGSRINFEAGAVTRSGTFVDADAAVISGGATVVDDADFSALTAGVSLPAAATSDGRDGFITSR